MILGEIRKLYQPTERATLITSLNKNIQNQILRVKEKFDINNVVKNGYSFRQSFQKKISKISNLGGTSSKTSFYKKNRKSTIVRPIENSRKNV